MKAILRKIDNNENFSFVSRIDEFSQFYNKWHFHPELELTYIVKGSGTRFVGDHIEYFQEGDLILIGSNLPHVWKSNRKNETIDNEKQSIAKVVQFLPNFLGDHFLNLNESNKIRELFTSASLGLKVFGKTKHNIIDLLDIFFNENKPIKKISLILEILETLALSNEFELLSSQAFINAYGKLNTEKINKIYEFTFNNYYQKITLEQVATMAHMSIPNFCKYFKSRTQKSFIQFLTEVRIGIACKMLVEDKKSIQQIAFDCGFNNISNFNRAFKIQKKQKPIQYRQSFDKLN